MNSHYLITYDISDSLRLRKIERKILNYAVRVQNSVYEAYLNEREFKKMTEQIKKLCHAGEDHVLIYKLCADDHFNKICLGIPCQCDLIFRIL